MPAAIDWTPELETTICERIMAGESVHGISLDKSMPCEASIWHYAARNEQFYSAIARAMEMRSERDIELCRVEAMNATANDWQVAQLRIRTFQWEAGKRKPKKYGERVQNEHSGPEGGAIQIVSTIPRPPKNEP